MRTSLTAVAAIMALVTCGTLAAQDVKPSISVTITTPSAVIKPSSDISLIITVKNISKCDLAWAKQPGYEVRDNPVDVRDEKGNPVGKSDYYEKLYKENEAKAIAKAAEGKDNGSTTMDSPNGSFRPFFMKPGQAFEERIIVSHEFDVSKPGIYTIQSSRTDPVTKASVKSNTITVNVVP